MKTVFTRAAEKSLMKLRADQRKRILSRIEAIAADPTSRALDVRPLAGSDLFRLRVGDHRVLFSLDMTGGELTVELIRTRGDIYKR